MPIRTTFCDFQPGSILPGRMPVPPRVGTTRPGPAARVHCGTGHSTHRPRWRALQVQVLQSSIAFTAVCSMLAGTGQAQDRSAKPQPPSAPSQPAEREAPSNRTIIVTGTRDPVRDMIDRNSYSITNDLQGTTGTMADVLRNVPSVEVDPEGNVSIRGDRNVVILIDGQPSGMLRGANLGTALQQLPPAQFERVEVMTNPTAAFGPEGSGGVINLIRRKIRQAGLTASAHASIGGRGRVNGGVSGAYAMSRTALSADGSIRRDELPGSSTRLRQTLDNGTGGFVEARQDARSVTQSISTSLRSSVEQAIGKSSRLTVDVTRTGLLSDTDLTEEFASGQRPFVRDANTRFELDSTEIRARFTPSLRGKNRKATLDASHQFSDSNRRVRSDTALSLPQRDHVAEEFRYGADQHVSHIKAEYGAGPDTARLQLGYELDHQDNRYDNVGLRGPDRQSMVSIEGFSGRFEHEQSVQGVYGTYERRFGKVTTLTGLRLEYVKFDLLQIPLGVRSSRAYVRFYPTLHLAYALGRKEQLKASFSRRVQRPSGQDLNPTREFRDPLNFRAGSPQLRPQLTDLLEIAWQRKSSSNLTQATLYYRSVTDGLTDVVERLSSGALLTTRENLGQSKTLGLEAVVNRRLTPRLSVNASANAAWTKINPGLPDVSDSRSAVIFSGRASITWRPTDRDNLQISGFLTGKSLRPQGHREAGGMVNLGYRRKLTDQIAAVVTVRDLLGNFGEAIVYDTPNLRDRVERKFGGRVTFVGLAYTLGTSKGARRDPEFDFDAGRAE